MITSFAPIDPFTPLVRADWSHDGALDKAMALYADSTVAPRALGSDLATAMTGAGQLSRELASSDNQVGVAVAVVQAADGFAAVALTTSPHASTTTSGRVVGQGSSGWAWTAAHALQPGVLAMVGPDAQLLTA